MMYALVPIAPINTFGDACGIHVGYSIHCPIVYAVPIDCFQYDCFQYLLRVVSDWIYCFGQHARIEPPPVNN